MFVVGRVLLWQNIVQSMIIFFSTVSKSIAVQLLMLNILLLIIGMLIDDNSACILAGILLVPVMSKLGVNPYHLAGIVMANLGLGLLTPPVAPLLYAAAGVTGVPLKVYFRYSIYFMLFANVPVIILTTYVPQVATYLPNLVFGTGLGMW
jgi:TRAP-type C4-dicarboxylate transport system permease large subunit